VRNFAPILVLALAVLGLLGLADWGRSEPEPEAPGARLCQGVGFLKGSFRYLGCLERFRNLQRRRFARISVFAPQEALYPDAEAQLCADEFFFVGDPYYEKCIQGNRHRRDTWVRVYNVQIIDCRYRNGRTDWLTPEECSKYEGTPLD
jgi:hypothetical protein